MIYTSRKVYEYISKQTNDPIVERKTCAISGTQFPIYQSDLDFYTKISPTFAGEKFQIPTPSLCPEERQRRRLSFRNERKLYKRTCNYSGKDIISIYAPTPSPSEAVGKGLGGGYKVYDQKIRRSDAWDPMDYGRDFDFTKSFTEQFGELMREVPLLGLNVIGNENSDYVNYCGYSKNCYMSFIGDYSENILYGHENIQCINCIDCTKIVESQECFSVIIGYKCFKVTDSYHVFHCSHSSGLRYCENCEYCTDCNNMRDKKYCIQNTQYSKEEYFEKLNTYIRGSLWNIELLSARNLINNEGFITNDFVRNSNNVQFSIDITNGEDVKYSNKVRDVRCSYDRDYTGYNGEMCLELCSCGDNIYSTLSCFNVRSGGTGCYYSCLCIGSSHLFGCIGLRNKQYCIFNKQYNKEDYEIMVGRIIRHMMQPRRDALSACPGETFTERGEFFHPSLSPFGYNETVAQEYYPLEYDGINLDSIEQTSPSARSAPCHLSLSGETKQGENNVANTTGFVPPDKEGGLGQGPRTGGLQQFGYHRSTYSSDPKIPDGVKTIDCRLVEWAEDSEQWKQLNQMTVGTHGNASVVGDLDICNTSLQQNYDICKQIILCEISGRPFMLQKAEIDFYRKHSISLPRKHPDVRHEERMKLRPGRTLYLRNCDCCGKEMLSVYNCRDAFSARPQGIELSQDGRGKPTSLQQVFCESCYQKEIYG